MVRLLLSPTAVTGTRRGPASPIPTCVGWPSSPHSAQVRSFSFLCRHMRSAARALASHTLEYLLAKSVGMPPWGSFRTDASASSTSPSGTPTVA